MHGLADGDGAVVLAPFIAVGEIDELEVEAFFRQRVVGKGAAEHGEKYEGGRMNDEGFDFDFLESVVKMAGGVFEGKRLEMGEGGFHGGYLRRFTLLAERRVRIWVMAISLSLSRRSGAAGLGG